MNMLVEFFKKLFSKKEEIKEQPEVACQLQEADTELVTEPVVVKKPKKRGRPKKKKTNKEA